MEYDENMMIGCTNRELAFFCPHCKTHIRIIAEPNLVRCKECKNWTKEEDDCLGLGWCRVHERRFIEEWFCADGERK